MLHDRLSSTPAYRLCRTRGGCRTCCGKCSKPSYQQSYIGGINTDGKRNSKNDLHHLLQTPSLQSSLLRDPAHVHASLRASNEALAAQLAHTQALAAQVAQTEGRVGQLRERVGGRLLAVRAQEQSWRKKQADMEGRLEEYGPRVLHGRLGRAIIEGEEEARVLEETWIDVGGGEGKATERETAEWVRRLREQRTIVWLRRERRGRWDEGRVGGWR